MKNSTNNRIKHAFEAVTPDVFDSVLPDLDEQKGLGIVMTQNRKNTIVKKLSGIAAAVVILAGADIFGHAYAVSNTVASTVALDVNPSVEIRVNAKEKVLSVDALNEDGRIIIGDMDFKGSDIDLAVNALIGSMLKNGYLNELTNSILVSVDNNDPEKSEALRQRIADEISVILGTDTFTGAVLSQTMSHDAAVNEIASANDISTGKAQLIHQITQQNTWYTAEDLAAMSINELNLITMSGGLKLENVDATGTASAKAYIGEEAAKQAALAHAGVAESEITGFEIELDWEAGV
ncbi:MAG: cell wall protein, partial [Clostridia bacterium]|nr:cell wall protein [Clostridia bacterium]